MTILGKQVVRTDVNCNECIFWIGATAEQSANNFQQLILPNSLDWLNVGFPPSPHCRSRYGELVLSSHTTPSLTNVCARQELHHGWHLKHWCWSSLPMMTNSEQRRNICSCSHTTVYQQLCHNLRRFTKIKKMMKYVSDSRHIVKKNGQWNAKCKGP